MVEATNAEAARRGLRARVRVMDAEHLDWPDAAFDRVFCGLGLMFFPDPDRALREFRHVLAPGGRLGVSTWRASQAQDLAAVLAQLGLPQVRQPGRITQPDLLAQRLRGAGFTGVRVVAEAESFHYADLEQYWQNARGTGQRHTLDGLDAAQTERVRAALAERLHGHLRGDGLHVVATALLAVARR
jgi:SAM-dependent methyltransferase